VKAEAKLLKEIKLPAGVLGLDASPDGKTLFAACLDGGVYRVDAETGARVILGRHESWASGVALVEGSGPVISAGYDGALQWLSPEGEAGQDGAPAPPIRRVAAHRFWSWQMALSPDGGRVASATGQYLCGGYKYEPLPESEPSVMMLDARTGEIAHALSHLPPVQSVTFSPDGTRIAAGNLMGDIKVWDAASGRLLASWNTPSFTGWGIIKGHYYTGGVFALAFTPDGEHLLAAGMGSTTDPAAGNGRQLWERFAWRESPPRKVAETRGEDTGSGLMEALAFHPSGGWFVMAGRLFKGKGNLFLFDAETGHVFHTLDTKHRVTRAVFDRAGQRLFLAGAAGQEKPKEGKHPAFGRIGIYEVSEPDVRSF
jgi:WD40 repeat protein